MRWYRFTEDTLWHLVDQSCSRGGVPREPEALCGGPGGYAREHCVRPAQELVCGECVRIALAEWGRGMTDAGSVRKCEGCEALESTVGALERRLRLVEREFESPEEIRDNGDGDAPTDWTPEEKEVTTWQINEVLSLVYGYTRMPEDDSRRVHGAKWVNNLGGSVKSPLNFCDESNYGHLRRLLREKIPEGVRDEVLARLRRRFTCVRETEGEWCTDRGRCFEDWLLWGASASDVALSTYMVLQRHGDSNLFEGVGEDRS